MPPVAVRRKLGRWAQHIKVFRDPSELVRWIQPGDTVHRLLEAHVASSSALVEEVERQLRTGGYTKV